jgi:hypothetical protein
MTENIRGGFDAHANSLLSTLLSTDKLRQRHAAGRRPKSVGSVVAGDWDGAAELVVWISRAGEVSRCQWVDGVGCRAPFLSEEDLHVILHFDQGGWRRAARCTHVEGQIG